MTNIPNGFSSKQAERRVEAYYKNSSSPQGRVIYLICEAVVAALIAEKVILLGYSEQDMDQNCSYLRALSTHYQGEILRRPPSWLFRYAFSHFSADRAEKILSLLLDFSDEIEECLHASYDI